MSRVPLLALPVLGGCVNIVRFPPDLWSSTWESGIWGQTGDTGTASEEEVVAVRIADARSGCDVQNAAWEVAVRSDGWVGEGRVNVFRTADGATEEHRLKLVASDPDGTWDELLAGPLPDDTPAVDQVPDVNSRFDCEGDATTLSFVVRIWDGTLQDCAVWGADPPGAIAAIRSLDPDVLGLGGCREM